MTPGPTPIPRRLQQLSIPSQQAAIADMRAAEERGRLVMESASAAAAAEIARVGPIVSDDWDEGASDEEDEVESGNVGHDTGVQTEQPTPHAGSDTSSSVATDPQSRDENNPDPFYIPCADHSASPPPPPSSSSLDPAHTHPAIQLLYLLVAWLHTHFHLPFLACNAVLTVVFHILTLAAGSVNTKDSYRTLPSIIGHLGVEPVFSALPVCPECLEVYPASIDPSQPCARCESPIFKLTTSKTSKSPNNKFRPFLQFPAKSIEAQLRDILAVDGMEDVLEGWRSKVRVPGEYQDNFDGAICQELKGDDGRLFFENPLPAGNSELRIGLTQGVDWCVFSSFISRSL